MAPSDTTVCNVCEQEQRVRKLAPGEVAKCVRCGSTLRQSRSHNRTYTAALSLAALFLYVPANIYPILRMQYLGRFSENTVWEGVVRLFKDGMWFVAAIVFLASIAVPLLKLLGLFFLVLDIKARSWPKFRTYVFRIITIIGPWAMLDVFLLSVLVALVKLRSMATVTPGPGIIAFTGVVVLTLLASITFDPRLIWEEADEGEES
jgi:paraquat-inducible protein A